MKRIIKIITIIALLMIPQVKAITSDEVIYQDDTVTKALDELNVCATGGDATSDEILSGKTAYVQGKLVVGTIPSKGAATYTPSTTNQIISAGQYLSKAQIIKGDSNLKAGNIACGVTIFGVTGTKDCAPSTLLSGLYTTAKIGEYVQMTPISTSYTISTSLTGYDSAQTIKPSELKLWRIIRFNDDGTIEMVSEYVSSKAVYFSGETGYKNLVNGLNTIAAQYANANYTVATRHMGYNNQTATITTSLSKSNCGGNSTNSNSYESSGCGDVSYQADANLVRSIYGNIKANKVTATTTATSYWISSRYYSLGSPLCEWRGRYVYTDGSYKLERLHAASDNGTLYTSGISASIRPIVTLKSGVTADSGSGTKAKPWVLS